MSRSRSSSSSRSSRSPHARTPPSTPPPSNKVEEKLKTTPQPEEETLDIYNIYDDIDLETKEGENDCDELYMKEVAQGDGTKKDTVESDSLYQDFDAPVETDTKELPNAGSGGGEVSQSYHHLHGSNTSPRDDETREIIQAYSEDYGGKGGSDSESGSGEHHSALYLGNLNWWTTDKQLEDVLSEFGKVKKLRFYEDKTNGKSRGFAFAEYEDTDVANQAFEKLQGREINGKQLVVSFASSESFKQLNTHNKGRKERREYQKKQQQQTGYRHQPHPNSARSHWQSQAYPPVLVPPLRPGKFRGRPPGFFPPPRRGHAFVPGVAPHINPSFFFAGNEYSGSRPREIPKPRSRSRSRERHASRERISREHHEDKDKENKNERKRREKRPREEDSTAVEKEKKRHKHKSIEKDKDKKRHKKVKR